MRRDRVNLSMFGNSKYINKLIWFYNKTCQLSNFLTNTIFIDTSINIIGLIFRCIPFVMKNISYLSIERIFKQNWKNRRFKIYFLNKVQQLPKQYMMSCSFKSKIYRQI
ncbi:unnamed protein product [Macrosiphum euphorbiae]|uniref:Uncharacterized protein n=1 Tax=Macrosiphum euphorbiae TaxID=13131 RepID=A0AAV0VT16_9HEMI|nr:unnamed protein product [Macrosiphum euphorbiae]